MKQKKIVINEQSKYSYGNLDFSCLLNFKTLLLLAPLAMIILFGFPTSALADQIGPKANEILKNGSRTLRRKKERELQRLATKQTADVLSSSSQYQQFVNSLTIEQLKKLPQRRLADINGNININLMLTGDDVAAFFSTIFGPKKSDTIITELTQPVKQTLIEKINQFGNRPLTIRGGILGWGTVHALKTIGKKVEKWSREEKTPAIQQIPRQVVNIVTDKTVQLAILAVILYHSAVHRKLPTPVKDVVEVVFPKKKITMGEWSVQKLQQSINFATSNAIYIIPLLILWIFRKQILKAIFGQAEGVNGAVNTIMDFVREQHKSIMQSGKDMVKLTTDWTSNLSKQVNNYTKRDMDEIIDLKKQNNSLQQELDIQTKVLHECDKQQTIYEYALGDARRELIGRTNLYINHLNELQMKNNEQQTIDQPPIPQLIDQPEEEKIIQRIDITERIKELKSEAEKK